MNTKLSIGRSARDHRSLSLNSESLILDLLHMSKSLSLEQVVAFLPELSWNQIFTAVDELSRRGEIMLHRRGFEYDVELVPSRQPALSCVD